MRVVLVLSIGWALIVGACGEGEDVQPARDGSPVSKSGGAGESDIDVTVLRPGKSATIGSARMTFTSVVRGPVQGRPETEYFFVSYELACASDTVVLRAVGDELVRCGHLEDEFGNRVDRELVTAPREVVPLGVSASEGAELREVGPGERVRLVFQFKVPAIEKARTFVVRGVSFPVDNGRTTSRVEFRFTGAEAQRYGVLASATAGVQKLESLSRIHRTAAQLREALKELETTGNDVKLDVPQLRRPDGRLSPLHEADLELLAVFGVRPESVRNTIADSNAASAGRARSSRLRWNRYAASSDLSRGLAALPKQIDDVREGYDRLRRCAELRAGDPTASGAVSELAQRAGGHMKALYAGDLALKNDLAALETLDGLLSYLKTEVALLDQCRGAAALADVVRIRFELR